MHSTYSDGRGSAQRIMDAANRLNLDFCILTDHDDLSALPHEGYTENGTLFLVGSEVTCSDDSHCLALGIRQPIPRSLSPQEAIDTIHSAGGMSILAHPFDRGSPRFGTYYPWKDWDVTGYSAIEMWNFLVNWGEGMTSNRQAALGYLFPLQRLTGPNPEGLRQWDHLNADRFSGQQPPLPIIGGVDAHGYFAYRRSLATIRTHIWGPAKQMQLPADRHTVLKAIRNGQSFVVNDLLHPARGFLFEVVGKGHQYPGGRAMVPVPADIRVRLPQPAPRRAIIRLLRNGHVVETVHDEPELHYEASQSGTYRCEVDLPYRRHRRPWIYSNAVHVR